MIERTVEELSRSSAPGRRAGRWAPRQRRSTSPTSTAAAAGPAAADIGRSAERARAPAGARRVALGAVRGRLAGGTHATLLDEGTSCARPGRCTDSSMPTTAACGSGPTGSPTRRCEARAARTAAERSLELGHLGTLGPAKWTYLPVRDCRRLRPLHRHLGHAVPRTAQLAKALIEPATEQRQITPKILTLHADRGGPMRSKPLAFFSRLRRDQDTWPPVHLQRQPLLGVELQDAEVPARFPTGSTTSSTPGSLPRIRRLVRPPHRHSGIG